jgi:hypothetical protein
MLLEPRAGRLQSQMHLFAAFVKSVSPRARALGFWLLLWRRCRFLGFGPRLFLAQLVFLLLAFLELPLLLLKSIVRLGHECTVCWAISVVTILSHGVE